MDGGERCGGVLEGSAFGVSVGLCLRTVHPGAWGAGIHTSRYRTWDWLCFCIHASFDFTSQNAL